MSKQNQTPRQAGAAILVAAPAIETTAHESGAASGIAPKIEIDSEVTRRIRQHARAHPDTEVCGVLIGDDAHGTVDIRASIEALNAAQGGTHVTFTQDAWELIYRVKDELYPEARIVGWYHSHPGFGVFLSEHDLFIQQNFFSSPGQVAWVYDPHTDEEGCFGWANGEVHRVAFLSIMDRNGDGVERTPKSMAAERSGHEADGFYPASDGPARRTATNPPWMRVAGPFLLFLCALGLGFAASYFLYPEMVPVIIDQATGKAMFKDPMTGKIVVRDLREIIPGLTLGQSGGPPESGAATSSSVPAQTPSTPSTPPAASSPPAQAASPPEHK